MSLLNLGEDLGHDRGDALGVGEFLVQDALRRDAELGNGEALGEFVVVEVVLLSAARE